MVNSILVFWITINLIDLWYLFVICLVDIKFKLSSIIQSAFWHKTATINPVTIVKFFNYIYDAIFMSLFDVSQTAKGLFGPILNYFASVKINNRKMLYLHCLVWLKSISHLATLQSQIQNNVEFYQWLLLFLEYIIKYLAFENPHTQNLDKISFDVNDPMIMP